jgi:hypothetical protein
LGDRRVKVLFSDKPTDYDGTQLASHWIFRNFNLQGDAAVAFIGGCDVKLEKMCDLADVRDGKPIFSKSMLHVIAEFFDSDLTRTILMQRLLVSLAQQEIIFRTGKPAIVRGGNDLFEDGAKLSVSIATASPVSTLIHFGINIESEGTPVKTKGLADYKIDPPDFARALLESFRDEVLTVTQARAKVRAVT